MTSAEHTQARHHPRWREIRSALLADPEVQRAYQELAPRFAVIRQLIDLREQLGLSQRDLADRAGMKQPQLARLESGQVEPKLDTLRRLAAAMHCRVQISFEPNDHSASHSPLQQDTTSR